MRPRFNTSPGIHRERELDHLLHEEIGVLLICGSFWAMNNNLDATSFHFSLNRDHLPL